MENAITKKICVLTQYGNIRWNNYGKCDFGDLSSTNHLNYSNKHGYTYINYTVKDSEYSEWHPTWIKIDLLQKLLPFFDYVVWIDADAVFVNQDIKIEDFIDGNVDLIIPKSEPDQFSNGTMWTNTMTNFMIWKNSDWSFSILKTLWETPNNFRFDFFHEQSRLDEILADHYLELGGENILNNIKEDLKNPVTLKNVTVLPYLYNRNFNDGEIKYIYHAAGNTPTKTQRIKNVLSL
jgi:hypothetical protein